MFTSFALSLLIHITLLTTLTSANPNPATTNPTTNPTTPALSTPNPSQASKLSSFFASLTAQPAYTSIASVVATAIPDSLIESIEDSLTATTPAAPGGFLFGTGTQNVLTTQSWFTALPSEVKGYFSSVVAEEKVITGGKKSAAVGRVGGNVRGGGWIGGVVCVVGFLGVVVWL